MGCAVTGYTGYMYPHFFCPARWGYNGYIDLDSCSAGLNIECSYAQIVQLTFRNVQSKLQNCTVRLTVNRYTQSFGQSCCT